MILFFFLFFFSTPTHLDKRCQVSKEWHVRLPISRSRKMRWEVILFPSGTSKGRGGMGGDGRDQLIAIVSRHKPTWFTIRASTRNLRRTSTFQFIFIATQTSYRVHIGRHGTANVFVSRIKRDVNGNALANSFFLSFSFFLSPFFFISRRKGGRERRRGRADRAVSFKWQDEASYNVINRWGGGRGEEMRSKGIRRLSSYRLYIGVGWMERQGRARREDPPSPRVLLHSWHVQFATSKVTCNVLLF